LNFSSNFASILIVFIFAIVAPPGMILLQSIDLMW
jgi:hypothetical protein